MKENDYVLYDLENVDPSPISPRDCNCGCGNTFQPRRTDQVYINKRHADKAYHEKVRKPKQKNQNIIEKIHRLNDRLCEKYFNASNSDTAICFWESILADGLNQNYTHGEYILNNTKYVLTYNYMYHLFNDNGVIKMKIKKQ